MKKILIYSPIILILLVVLFFSLGPLYLIYLTVSQTLDRNFSPGIEIVNDTNATVEVTTERNGFGNFNGTYCTDPMGEVLQCPPAKISSGDRVVQSHGRRNQGDKVRFLVPVSVAWEDYHEKTDGYYDVSGKFWQNYKLRDDAPLNYGIIQEASFLCFQRKILDAELRYEGLFKKAIYSYRWSDVLKHPSEECGFRG